MWRFTSSDPMGNGCHITAQSMLGRPGLLAFEAEVKAVHSPKVQPKKQEKKESGVVVEGRKEKRGKDSWHGFSPGHPQRGKTWN